MPYVKMPDEVREALGDEAANALRETMILALDGQIEAFQARTKEVVETASRSITSEVKLFVEQTVNQTVEAKVGESERRITKQFDDFKKDITSHFSDFKTDITKRLDQRLDSFDKRLDSFDRRMESLQRRLDVVAENQRAHGKELYRLMALNSLFLLVAALALKVLSSVI